MISCMISPDTSERRRSAIRIQGRPRHAACPFGHPCTLPVASDTSKTPKSRGRRYPRASFTTQVDQKLMMVMVNGEKLKDICIMYIDQEMTQH
jgi:hypothetical protein